MNEENPEPSYYAILEADVRYDDELKPNEKLLYAEITALSKKEGYCWASNSYFAELFNVNKSTVSRWISNLEDKGHIHRRIIRGENNQVKERKITPIEKKINRGIEEKDNTPIEEIRKDNITSNSNSTSSSMERDEKITEIKNYIRKKVGRTRLTGYESLVEALEEHNSKTIKRAADLACKRQKDRQGHVNINSYKYICRFIDEVLADGRSEQEKIADNQWAKEL